VLAGSFQSISDGEQHMTIVRLAVLIFASTFAITGVGVSSAQQPSGPPPAPVPAPIFSARKIFISNATGELPMPPDTLDLAYNEFYAAMKSWGRYEVVAAPSDADLVFEIRFHYSVGPTGVSQGSGGSTEDFQLRLSILDSKTRTILWALSRSVPQSNNKMKSRQFFDQTMATLVESLEKLASQPSPTAADQKH
jgi:hypothetical protein